jgi:serine/threonine protein kinase
MAEVYIAMSEGIGGFCKAVALKLILPAYADDPEFRQMFLAEARLVGRLDHPCIAQVLDAGEQDDELYIVIEHVHGRTLREFLRGNDDAPPLEVSLFILRETCGALQFAHNARDENGMPLGIVHRDVSPSNLMIRYDGRVKLLDFGIAKVTSSTLATRSGVIKGKGGYMSPEQCVGQPVTHQADIFTLGILLYEATTRRRLFRGDNDYEVMNRIVEGRFRRPRQINPEYPEVLEQIVLRALELRPEDRFEDAEQMQNALDEAAAELGLRPSSRAVAEYMDETFGPAPSLSLPTTTEAPGHSTIAVHPGSLRRGTVVRRPVAWGIGITLGAVFGGLAVGMVRSDADTGPPVGKPPDLVEASRTEDDVAPTPEPATTTPEPRPEVEVSEPESPGPNDTVPPDAEKRATPAGDVGSPRKRPSRRSRGSRRKKPQSSSADANQRRDPLFPWEN